jgi:hypothetical protein
MLGSLHGVSLVQAIWSLHALDARWPTFSAQMFDYIEMQLHNPWTWDTFTGVHIVRWKKLPDKVNEDLWWGAQSQEARDENKVMVAHMKRKRLRQRECKRQCVLNEAEQWKETERERVREQEKQQEKQRRQSEEEERQIQENAASILESLKKQNNKRKSNVISHFSRPKKLQVNKIIGSTRAVERLTAMRVEALHKARALRALFHKNALLRAERAEIEIHTTFFDEWMRAEMLQM